jgi:hypothetical protein
MNSSSVLLPLSYWGSIEYWKNIVQSSVIYIEQHEHLPKQTIRTFCLVCSANGLQKLSVPVNNPAQKTPVNRVKIINTQRWQHQHWYSLISAYRSTPFFDYYQTLIEPIYTTRYEYLMELNKQTLEVVKQILKLNTSFSYTTHYIDKFTEGCDLRNIQSVKYPLIIQYPSYYQVFNYKWPFYSNVCVLDLIFNLGPDALGYLQRLK